MMLQRKGDQRRVSLTAARKLDESKSYRLSRFVWFHEEDGFYLIGSTLTAQVYRLEETERKALAPLRDGESVSWEYLRRMGLEEFARQRLLVEEDWDDAGQYRELRGTLALMNPEEPGLRLYTILPTTACNARCVYCFEEGFRTETMTRETAARLVDFICETKSENEIRLDWFGGEPLLCAETISYICRELTARDVAFRSSVTTNGSLVTPELAREAAEVWKLKKAQVSLDGDRESYRLRKRYLNEEKYNYDGVMRGVELLAEAGVQVVLRVNCDWGNLPGLDGFLREMEERFRERESVSLYLAMLNQEHASPDSMALQRRMDADYERVALSKERLSGKKNLDCFKLHACMADDLEHSVVIDPRGNFYACEHITPGTSWGNIFDGVTDAALLERLKAPAEPSEECGRCLFLPWCTAFSKKGCQVTAADPYCRERKLLELKRECAKFVREERPKRVHSKNRIAGHSFMLRTQYASAHLISESFRTEDEPEFTLDVTQADIDWEKEHTVPQPEDAYDGEYPDRIWEILAAHRLLLEKLLDYDVILLHASCIAVDGQGYCFTAPSGTGKSTHTRLWQALLGERAVMVNDDKPLLHIGETVTAYGSPWNGKENRGENIAVPLRAICFLSRAAENSIEPVTAREVYQKLLTQIYRPDDPARMAKTLALADGLLGKVKLYCMGCNMEREAAELSFRTMSGG